MSRLPENPSSDVCINHFQVIIKSSPKDITQDNILSKISFYGFFLLMEKILTVGNSAEEKNKDQRKSGTEEEKKKKSC